MITFREIETLDAALRKALEDYSRTRQEREELEWELVLCEKELQERRDLYEEMQREGIC